MTTEKIDECIREFTLRTCNLESQLEATAGECSEFANAALSYLRSSHYGYISEDQALERLAEEIGDVENMITGIKAMINQYSKSFEDKIISSRENKVRQWGSRIESDCGVKVNLD